MAVIDAPSGSFSTEASAPEGVPARVAEAIQEVLGDGVADILLVDDLGTTWTVAGSEEQLRRLAV